MQLKISKKRIAFASVASVFWILQGMGNLSSGRWSKPIAVLFMILTPVLTFIVAVTVDPARQGIFGSPDDKRLAIRQIRSTTLIWVVVAVVMLVVFKVAHWYQTQ